MNKVVFYLFIPSIISLENLRGYKLFCAYKYLEKTQQLAESSLQE